MTKVRADQLLVTRGLFESRARAQAAIEAGLVTAGGIQVKKPAQPVPSDAELIAQAAHPYVSRGGVKLAAALKHFDFNPDEKTCLDIGASTGGFTDVLLRNGARLVFAVDVGSGQLHPSLKSNNAVIELENTDARALESKIIHPPAELITIDVSFISLKLIVPILDSVATPRAEMIALVKPQFEAGRKLVRKGVIRDTAVHRSVCDDIATFAENLGWQVLGIIESPIEGGDGNREFLLGARRGRPRQTKT
jgi:23S rRNA (cytidine1920-2'-O)/16S rRNA (cytidine1409-2'-O)-methyltransferase